MIWLRRGILLLAAIIVLLGALVAIAYYTPLGVRVAASVAESKLGESLRIGSIDGSPYGGLRIDRLRFASAGLAIDIDALVLEVRWSELAGRRASVQHLGMERIALQLPVSKAAAESEATFDWREPIDPIALPSLPVAIEIESLRIDELVIRQGDKDTRIERIEMRASANRDAHLRIERLSANSDAFGSLELQAAFDGQQAGINRALWRGPDGQRAQLSGTVAPFGSDAQAQLSASWSDLTIPSPQTIELPEGSLSLEGWLNDYGLLLETAVRSGERSGQLTMNITGDLNGASLNPLTLSQEPAGELETARITGTVNWQQAIDWDVSVDARAIDLATIAPDWPSRIDLDLQSRGELLLAEDRVQARNLHLDIRQLQGQLRGEPIRATGALRSEDSNTISGNLALYSGDDQVELSGRYGSSSSLDLRLQVGNLGRWLASSAGQLDGTVTLRGDLTRPDLEAELRVGEFAMAGSSLQSVSLQANITDGRRGTIELAADDILASGRHIQNLQLSLDGNLASHRLRLQLQEAIGEATMELAGGLSGLESTQTPRWQGQLDSWRLALNEETGAAAGEWALRSPSDLRLSASEQSLATSCLQRSQQRLCLSASQSEQTGLKAMFELSNIPLEVFNALRAAGSQASRMSLRGSLNANGNLDWPRGTDWPSVQADVTTEGAAVSLVQRPDLGWMELNTLSMQANADSERAQFNISSDLRPQGQLRADITLQNYAERVDDSRIEGQMAFELEDLRWLELIMPELVDARGSLRSSARISGPLFDPDLAAELNVDGFAAEVPAVSLKLNDGSLQISGDLREGQARLQGQVHSGDGQLSIDGQLGLDPQQGLPLAVNVSGSNFEAADTQLVSLAVSPNLNLEGRLSEKLNLSGRLDVDRLTLNLEQIESTTRPSEDVVFAEEVTTESEDPQPPGPALTAQVRLGLGDGEQVSLSGFGLQAQLGGDLAVSLPENGDPTGSGQLSVNGRYRSWGQNLQVDNGRLIFSDGPLDNPGLDIRAYRPLPEVTAGIHLTGTANSPNLNLYSEPSLSDADTLSYIITGRPVDAVGQGSGDQQQQMASAALAYGINASSLPSKLGLDTVEVSDRPDLGGSTLTVGKRLSPRLMLSYATSLFSSESLVQLRYELSRRWRLRVESSTVESRGAIEYYNER